MFPRCSEIKFHCKVSQHLLLTAGLFISISMSAIQNKARIYRTEAKTSAKEPVSFPLVLVRQHLHLPGSNFHLKGHQFPME